MNGRTHFPLPPIIPSFFSSLPDLILTIAQPSQHQRPHHIPQRIRHPHPQPVEIPPKRHIPHRPPNPLIKILMPQRPVDLQVLLQRVQGVQQGLVGSEGSQEQTREGKRVGEVRLQGVFLGD